MNGDNHGSSARTPVPSFAIPDDGAAVMTELTAASLTLSILSSVCRKNGVSNMLKLRKRQADVDKYERLAAICSRGPGQLQRHNQD